MSNGEIFVNSNLLDPVQLRPAFDAIIAARAKYEETVKSCSPVVPQDRRALAEVDHATAKAVEVNTEMIAAFVDCLVQLASGHGESLDELRALVVSVEDANKGLASGGSDTPHRR